MAAKFDNLDDVQNKFAGTICYFDKKPIMIKHAEADPEIAGKFMLYAAHYNQRYKYVKLDDPLFNYKDFNIGYANQGEGAVWWYRKPGKQYRQGLKKDQLYYRLSNPQYGLHDGFQFNKPFVAMLENVYPALGDCEDLLRHHEVSTIAFHKDFALAWDEIHGDFVLEYRGKRIGASVGRDLFNYRLLDEHKHLQEALKEALPQNVHG